jgi:hypothetical protein
LLELELWLELELELWLELELELWLELELELWLELELELWLELELLLWFDDVRFRRLIVRRFATARALHHSIGFPWIFRSTVTVTRRPCEDGVAGRATEVRTGLSERGATVAWRSSDRADTGPRAAPTATPRAPIAPAYIARIFLFSNGMSTCLSSEGDHVRAGNYRAVN